MEIQGRIWCTYAMQRILTRMNSGVSGVCNDGHIFRGIIIPIIMILPLWLRCAQNLRRCFDTRTRYPHLANAAKYSVAMTVTLFGKDCSDCFISNIT